MTFDRREVIKIPVWLVSILLPMLISAIVAISVFAAGKATLDEKVKQTESSIEKLDAKKTDRTEMNMILLQLSRIEKKVDDHASHDKQ